MESNKPHIIQLPKITDPRGNLSIVEGKQHVPFDIKRAYWIYDVPSGMYREGRALRTQQEFIIALSGSFDVILDDGNGEQLFHMDRAYYGLYVPPMTWRRIDNFASNSVVYVLSSALYDPEDYIENFEEYIEVKGLNG